jgi:parallel beta-helix repeat protein
VEVEPGAYDIAVLSTILRRSARAGLWFVGAAGKTPPALPPGAVATPAVRVVDSVFDANASGMVVGNQSALVQKSRFLSEATTALTVLGGAVQMQDSQVQGCGGTALSITDGHDVVLRHNTFADNPMTAILVRDSDAVIEGNTLTHNGLGIVVLSAARTTLTRVSDNLITRSTADAITVIGGATLVQNNRVLDNLGAGVRTLDLLDGHRHLKATPRLDANILHGNAIDTPTPGVYRLTGAAP